MYEIESLVEGKAVEKVERYERLVQDTEGKVSDPTFMFDMSSVNAQNTKQ